MEPTKAFNCYSCKKHFNYGKNTPLVIHCGHSFCKTCLEDLHKKRRVKCPKCKYSARYDNVDDIPINHALVKVM